MKSLSLRELEIIEEALWKRWANSRLHQTRNLTIEDLPPQSEYEKEITKLRLSLVREIELRRNAAKTTVCTCMTNQLGPDYCPVHAA